MERAGDFFDHKAYKYTDENIIARTMSQLEYNKQVQLEIKYKRRLVDKS